MKLVKYLVTFFLSSLFIRSIDNFKKIYSNKEFYKLRNIFYELNSTQFSKYDSSNKCLIKSFPNKNIFMKQLIAKIIINQLFIRIIYAKFNSNSKIIFPLPNEYQVVLIKNGFKINFFLSTFTWYLLVSYKLFCAYFFLIKFVFFNLISYFKFEKKNYESSIFFVDLNIKNLPNENIQNSEYYPLTCFLKIFPNISNFYFNFKPKKKHFNKDNNINIKYKYIYPYISFINLVYLLISSTYQFFLSFILIFIGKWWNAFILEEYFKYKIFEISDSNNLSTNYLFSNTSILFRPLWTYILDKKGSNASVYFYSLSEQPYCQSEKINTSLRYFKNINWNNYYYWDEYHLDKLKSFSNNRNSEFFKSGPILLGEYKKFNKKIKKRCISIFDIEPYNLRKYIGYSTYNDYGFSINIDYVSDFLLDIIEIAKEYNYIVLHKPKRKSLLRINEYSSLLDNLQKLKNYILIDELSNPVDMIKFSDLSISIPFTSTGVLSDILNTKSIYYDPKQIIIPECKNSKVELISGKDNLHNLFKKLN